MGTNVGTGDRGMTSLLSGERVGKSHARVEAVGEVDELASVLGALAASFSTEQGDLRRHIQGIQGELLRVGALIATSPDSPTLALLARVGPEQTHALEEEIRKLEAALPPLQSFILPGGHPSAAWAHVARTVCRRAERRVFGVATGGARDAERVADAEGVMGGIPTYLNRLSTYLFVLGRFCNKVNGVPEATWKG
jgi:cob(I)alamin adenosyltransferase